MKSTSSKFNLYKFNGRVPLRIALPFGLQHILAMLVSNMTPIVIVGGICGIQGDDLARLIQSSMIIAGIGTLIQLFPLWRIGSGLPMVTGVSFTFVSIFIYIGSTRGFSSVLGAVLIGGIIEGVLGLLAVFWIKLISPIVAACVVTALGVTLLPVGAESFGGGTGAADFGSWQNWVVGSVTLVVCLLFSAFGKGMINTLSVLFGLAVGYVLSICLGMVDFSAIADSQIIGLPSFLSVKPEFHLASIISATCLYIVAATDTIGNCEILAEAYAKRAANTREIGGSIACNGFVSALGAAFGCLPITTYAQNTGLVVMNKVINRMTISCGVVILILAGFFPIFGNLLASIPQPVLGGCSIMLFGMIVINGIDMIAKCGFTTRNMTIASLSLAVGIGFTMVPELFDLFPDIVRNIFAENCVAIVFLMSIILNLIMPKDKEPDEESA